MAKKISIFIFLFFSGLSLQAQAKLELEVLSNGPERELFKASNIVNSARSAAILNISSGTGTSIGEGFITIYSKDYSASPGYSGYFDLQGAHSGIVMRAADANGNIRMLTGGSTLTTNTRVLIDPSGNVGIGSTTPVSRLQVANGSVYVSDPNGAIVLTSQNGSCWNITVNNSGALTTTSSPCP